MKLYDVAFTVYHALDSRALVALSAAANASAADEAKLEARAAATETALHRDLFDAGEGQYANKLYNGTFYKRWAPTIFAPMLLNSTPASRIPRMMAMMGNSSTFCVSASPEKVPLDVGAANATNVTILWRMQADAVSYMAPGQSITCASEACLQATVLDVAEFGGIEAIVDANRNALASLPLQIYRATSGGDRSADQVLSTKSPGAEYTLANASAAPEGWCAPAASGGYTQPLMLWYSPSLSDHRTCGGTPGCSAAQMGKDGYAVANGGVPLCFAKSAVDVGSIPCRYGMPSISRSDVDGAGKSTFWEQTYWRGRIWAPQYFLVYAGLKAQEHLPSARAKKAELADQAKRLFTQQLELFGQVNENTNGVLGVGSDNTRADAYYHWGALHALIAIAETGAYPSSML